MKFLAVFLIALGAMAFPAQAGVKLKDLVDVEGVRGNDLVGYGLVVGLNGTGDGLRNIPYTEEALSSLLERLGINVQGEEFRPKNVAAVLITGTLPPFARAGSQIDITVSAIGDAKDLSGGTLVMTPLNAADGQIYAVAQGTNSHKRLFLQKATPPPSQRAYQPRAPFQMAPAWNASSPLILMALKIFISPCARRTSQQPRALRRRSTQKLAPRSQLC